VGIGFYQPEVGYTARINVEGVTLEGEVAVPADVRALILFAYGSGENAHTPWHRTFVSFMSEGGYGVVQTMLLTSEEAWAEVSGGLAVLDTMTMTRRLIGVLDWTRDQIVSRQVPIVLMGAGQAAEAVFNTDADNPAMTAALVTVNGHADLAQGFLLQVSAPVLMIAGRNDRPAVHAARFISNRLATVKETVIMPGVGRRLDEIGAADEVARVTMEWLDRHVIGKHSREDL
jgi:putative phosphoribosyl transferase